MASCGVVPEQCSANRVFRGGPMRCCPVLGLSSLNFPRLRQQFASDELEGHGWHSGGRSQLEVLRPLLLASRTQRRLALRSPGRCTSPVDLEGASDASPVGALLACVRILCGDSGPILRTEKGVGTLKTVSAIDTGCQSTLSRAAGRSRH